MLKGLLERNVQKRLGAARSTMFEVGGVSALKAHRFFNKIDWQLLVRKQGEDNKEGYYQGFKNKSSLFSFVQCQRR